MRKSLSMVLAVLMVLSLLMVSGGGAMASGESVCLKFYLWDQNMLDGVVRRQALVTAANPNITFENTVLPWGDYWTKLQTSLPSSEGPDMFQCEANHTSEYGSLGFIEPLNGYIQRDSFDMSVYTEGSKKLFTNTEGVVYGIPLNYDNAGLYYNKTLFDEAGLEYPKDGMSFAEFRDLANKLTKRDGETVTQWGAVAGPWPQNAVYGLILGNGVYPYGEDCQSSNFTDPRFKETMQFLYDMTFVDKVMPDGAEQVSIPGNQMFMNNMLAMYIAGPSNLKEFSETMGDTFDIAVPPMNKKQAISIMGMDLCISANTKYKEAAWETLKVFGSEEAAAIEAEMMCPGFTSGKSVWEANYPDYHMYAFTAAAELGQAVIPKYKMGTVDNYFQEMLSTVFSNEKSVDDALSETDAKIKAVFDELKK